MNREISRYKYLFYKILDDIACFGLNNAPMLSILSELYFWLFDKQTVYVICLELL